jgi:choline-sulfatase
MTKSNILVLLCDQLKLDLLGCYGDNLVKTPNIDQLAEKSFVFDQAYTPTAICSPARASLMTGLYPHTHHMYNNSSPRYSHTLHLPSDVIMIQDWAASQTDYESAYFGKWHIGPADDLFNSSFHHTANNLNDPPLFAKGTMWHPGKYLAPTVKTCVCETAGTLDIPMEKFPDVVAAQYTKDFLLTRNKEKPFLLFCAFPGPHSPWFVPDSFGIRYKPSDIPLPANRFDNFNNKPFYQKKLRAMEDGLGIHTPYKIDDKNFQEYMSCCYSYMELIDTLVGEIIAQLKELGLYENTHIVFTSDHGDMAGAHGFLSKGAYMYDEIYRIPLIMKLAGKEEGRRIQSPVQLMDLTATFCHIMTEQPHNTMGTNRLHGHSLLPMLKNKEEWLRKVHYAEFHGDWYGHYSARMVTDGKWKLVWNFSDLCELYDLERDPEEITNLFYNSTYCNIRHHYFEILLEEAERLDDYICFAKNATPSEILEVEDRLFKENHYQ